MKYFLCLGSNLGDREANLTNCLLQLKKINADVKLKNHQLIIERYLSTSLYAKDVA